MNGVKPLLQTLKGEKQSMPPMWIMRQAGRYLPEYRAIREKVDFLTLCGTPELACEVTLQPLRRFALDGAILFSDILVPLVPMGMQLRFGKDHGPVFDNPIESLQHVKALRHFQPGDCEFVGQALKLIKAELPPEKTLLGFAGAPFTLASYMVEGQGTKNFLKIKSLMFHHPDVYRSLMDKLVTSTISYLEMQIRCGADALQLFDSWGGQLSPEDYLEFAHPYAEKIIRHIQALGVPVIHFAKNGGGLWPVLREGTARGLGVSWEYPLSEAIEMVDSSICLQGNLDPAALFGPQDRLRNSVQQILNTMAAAPHPHIFNLGHGIYPQTPVENVSVLVDYVKDPKNNPLV